MRNRSRVAMAFLSMAAVLGCFAVPAMGFSVDEDIDPSRRYDQVTFLTAHNAFASTEEGWVYAQQTLSIPHQLNLGVRGLMLDIHLGQGGKEEPVCTEVKKDVKVIEDQCKKHTRQDCKDVKKVKDECKQVSEKVCEWAPWPTNELCKTVTKTVCKPVEYTEKVCTNVDEIVCAPVEVTKHVTETVCDGTKLIPSGPKTPRLCHEQGKDTNCELTRTLERPLREPQTLAYALTQTRQFLDNNKNAVVTIFFESYVNNKDLVDKEFAQSGINKYLFEPDAWFANPQNKQWPTIEQMRKNNKRLVVFTGGKADGRPDNWKYFVETKYDLREFKGCEIRGETDKNINDKNVTLLTLNHFNKIVLEQYTPPTLALVTETNSYNKIMDRVKKCQNGVHRIPNFIALDFVDKGDGFKVVKELNKQQR